MNTLHLHNSRNVLLSGQPLDRARRAMVLVHGRGGAAHDILSLTQFFSADDMAFLAPWATENTWYPYSFLAPTESNEPGLSSGLAIIGEVLERIEKAGISSDRVFLLGFSQGACLTLEFAARNARKYGGIIGLSGGVIGPDGTPRNYPGTFDGTPVFLGCSDRDPHIPAPRVTETSKVFTRMGARVDMRLYPNMPHTIIEDEIEAVRIMISGEK